MPREQQDLNKRLKHRRKEVRGSSRRNLLACGLSLLALGASSPALAEGCLDYKNFPIPGVTSCIGSYHPEGDASDGDVYVSGPPSDASNFIGGYAGGDGRASRNKVYVYGALLVGTYVKGGIYGGYAAGSGNAEGNVVTVVGGGGGTRIDGSVYGGWSRSGAAIGNQVSIQGGLIAGYVVGGRTGGNGEVSGNEVQVSGGKVGGSAFGGYSEGNGEVKGNRVIINGGLVGGATGGRTGGGNATDNNVEVRGGSVEGRVYGGMSIGGTAKGNKVTVSGGEVTLDIYGGYSENGSATGNTVEVTGGRVGGNIYGGYTRNGDNATGNTVRISGTPNFGSGTMLYGGWSRGGGDDYSGNTLEINTDGVHVRGADNFQHWLFGVSKNSVGKTMLLTDNRVTMTKKGKPDADLGLQFRDRDKMDVGDKVGLMNKTDGGDFDLNGKKFKEGDNDHLNVHQDAGLRGRDYDFHVTRDGSGDHKIDVTVDHVTDDYLNAKAGSVTKSRTMAQAVLNKGGDFIANEGMNGARIASGLGSGLNAGSIEDVQSGAFGAITGGHLNYRLDGHTAVNGLSLLGGYGVGIPLPHGQALVGAFVEGGWSTYKGRSNQGVNSDGDSRYFGGGVLTRYELSGFYVEGSGRIGRSENHYDSDLTDSTGESARYKTDNTYYGLHAGVGYVVGLGGGVSIDPSTKYFWTHQTGSNVSILGDPVRFSATNSQRWRTGARVNVAVAPGVVPYVGGYYEHEFDSKAKATDYGFEIAAPSLKGDTGIAEVGVTFGAPADVFKVDLGVQGYAGKRSGVIGSLKGRWMF